MAFKTRAQIGLPAPKPNCLTERVHPAYGITWHWTGTSGNLYKPDPIARLKGIYDYHVNHLGYCDIAYNGAFDADGNLYGLRDSKFVSAHASSTNNVANVYTNGIVFLEDRRGITKAALEAMHTWINLHRLVYGANPQQFTHQWWKNVGGISTDCPGVLVPVVKMMGGHA